MKKKQLKVLKLNKKSISNLEMNATKGGYQSENGSCYWQDCPSNDPNFMSDCYCPNPGGTGGGGNQTQFNCGSNAASCFNVDCEEI